MGCCVSRPVPEPKERRKNTTTAAPVPTSVPRPTLGPRPVGAVMAPKLALTEEDILSFAQNGYLHLRGIVPPDQVAAAVAVIDGAYAQGNHGYSSKNPTDVVPTFGDDVSRHQAIIAPLKDTPLFHCVEQLIGHNDAWQPQRAQIALREPSQYWRKMGWNEDTKLNPDGWHIDGGPGKYANVGSPFTLLVGVCLSPGQDVDKNHGQFLAWPGSHHVLHRGVAEKVRNNEIKDPHSIFAGTREQRPDIGEPVRVLMRPGDAVLAHQRLGHSGGPNLGPHIRKNLYLRVHNKKHDHYLASGELLNGSVFCEYRGVREVLQRRGMRI